MDAVDQSIRLEKYLAVFGNSERKQFPWGGTPVGRRSKTVWGPKESLKNMVSTGRGIVFGDVSIDVFEVALRVLG